MSKIYIIAGADAVKFQTFDPESTVTSSAQTAGYQQKGASKTSYLCSPNSYLVKMIFTR